MCRGKEVTEENATEVAPREYKPVWPHIIAFTVLHLAGLYGAYLLIGARVYTLLFSK